MRAIGPVERAARAAHIRRVIAAVAFWAVAVLFVTDVSLLSGWLTTDTAAAAATSPAVSVSETPSSAESPPPPTETLATPFTPPPSEAAPSESDTVLLDASGTTITFPAPPTASEQVIDIAGVPTPADQYVITQDGVTYTVGVIEYPEQVDVDDPAVNLLASVSGAAGSAGARVSAQDVTLYQGVPAAEFTLTTGSVDVRARYVLDDRTLYAASVTHATGAVPDDAQEFLDSLDLAG